MKIDPRQITIREITNGYKDSNEAGVVGYGGKLNIRPAYQREFIYKEKQRNAVIDTVLRGFPLNAMYWCISDNGYELLDGQQRTISICQYVNNEFSINVNGNPAMFHNLTHAEQEAILGYELNIFVCDGTDREKLDWFKTINIGTIQLTDQELRNAVYTGEWLTEAKKYFSKTQCPAGQIAGKYLNGSAIRQDYLESALSWIGDRDGLTIEQYMANHQHDTNCNELWLYFQSVIAWVQATFTVYRKEMKGRDWGVLYNRYKNNSYDPKALETQIATLMMDDDVSNKGGIYHYVLGGPEKSLHIRAFTAAMARAAYERQQGICPACGKHFELHEMQADHITPWSKGGATNADNCQMLCAACNRIKSNK